MDAALDEVNSLDGSESGKILIGALPMSGAYLIGAAIARLTERFPKARIVVTNAPYAILFNSLRNGAIDMIFGVLRRPDWDIEVTEIPPTLTVSSPARAIRWQLRRKSPTTTFCTTTGSPPARARRGGGNTTHFSRNRISVRTC